MFCISFNWLTLLISSSARKREHRKLPPFLSRSLSLYLLNSQSGSQALRLSEREQSDWVMSQMPVVWSHGLMLCQTSKPLAHSTRFLSQQRNVFPTWAFYSFAVSFSPPCPRLLSVSIFLICQFFFSNLFALFLYIFRTLAFFAFLLSYLNVTVVKDTRLQSTPAPHPFFHPSLFLIAPWVRRLLPAVCWITATHTDKCITYMGNQHF